MRFNKEDIQFLNGEKFTDGKDFKVSKTSDPNIKRIEYLSKVCKDKKVLHIGFADHLPLIENKITNNTWLHQRLIDNTSLCIGLDINVEAIKFCKEKLTIDNIHYLDIVEDNVPEFISNDVFDYMVLGEILEHVDNPVQFLKGIKEKYSKHVKKIIITVPNFLDLTNIVRIPNNVECINSDHRFWFSPYTLAKILYLSGFKDMEFSFSQSYMPNSLWQRFLIKRYPMLRETLIMIANF